MGNVFNVQVGSPRPKGRAENRDTICRNVLIYGHCRYEDTCAFNHDQTKNVPNSEMSKKLNAESPSFTSASLQQGAAKKTTFTPQAANAAVFTPRGAGAVSPNPTAENDAAVFNAATAREFTPQGPAYDFQNGVGQDGHANPYDSFSMGTMNQALPNQQYNPYANDQSNMGAQAAFYQGQSGFSAPNLPINYDNYFPKRPKGQLQPNQRYMQDFFMDEEMRLDIQRKSEAGLQMIMPPGYQNNQVDNYHWLMTLDTTGRKTNTLFNHVTWVYKARSIKNNGFYCLRRLEGFRLSSELAMKSVKDWKHIMNANIVKLYDVFTTRAFGDRSLVFSQDYYPLAQTLMEVHFPPTPQNRYQRTNTHLTEQELWSYIAQITNALTAIHEANLAAQCLDLSKIIITDKGVIQLSGCAILDVVNYERHRPLMELQQEDFILFGKAILSLATSTHPQQLNNSNNLQAILGSVTRSYSVEMRDMVRWLITPSQPGSPPKTVGDLTSGISGKILKTLDSFAVRREFEHGEYFKEYCNGKAARHMMMLAIINEREFGPNGEPNWSEQAERYQLKLFRDYVFHQVDENGHSVVDVAHMFNCMYKLDAATQEQIRMTSRDNSTDFITSYQMLKKMLYKSFGELTKSAARYSGGF